MHTRELRASAPTAELLLVCLAMLRVFCDNSTGRVETTRAVPLSSLVSRPSSLVPRPSPLVPRSSSLVPRLSSLVSRLSSLVSRLSSLLLKLLLHTPASSRGSAAAASRTSVVMRNA